MKLEQTYFDIKDYGEKYHFYYHAETNTIVCTTLYKGQMVRGIAKCNNEDIFDLDTGKKLAYLRCRQKFMRKKLRRAQKVFNETYREVERAQRNLSKSGKFLDDSEDQLDVAIAELNAFEAQLNN